MQGDAQTEAWPESAGRRDVTSVDTLPYNLFTLTRISHQRD